MNKYHQMAQSGCDCRATLQFRGDFVYNQSQVTRGHRFPEQGTKTGAVPGKWWWEPEHPRDLGI